MQSKALSTSAASGSLDHALCTRVLTCKLKGEGAVKKGQDWEEGQPGFTGKDASCSSTLACCVASCELLYFSELWFPHAMA